MMRTNTWMLLCAAGACAAIIGGCHREKRNEQPAPAEPAPAATPGATQPATPTADAGAFSTPADYDAKPVKRLELNSGMVIEDLKIGDGPAALPKALVTFHYRGKVQGGKEFDCTLTREGGPKPEVQPLHKLFDGLAGGMIGIQTGGRRRLTIPPMLAGGIVGMKDPEGNVLIPPDATLIYVIDAVEIKQQVITTPTPAPTPGKP